MSKFIDSLSKMRFLDEIAENKSFIHGVHPLAKVIVTITYLFIVVSFGKYEISGLLPLIFYPVMLFSVADIPLVPMLKRMLFAMPFIIGIGVFNPVFDREINIIILGMPISGGWISFLSLLLKGGLTVLAALLLVATTGMVRIASASRMLFVPRIFVLQMLLTYRYISVLIEEAASIWNAYMLRAPEQKGISFKVWGTLAGQLLIRTYDRAQKVYQAMVLRGFEGEYNTGREQKVVLKDYLYFSGWLMFFIVVRYYNLPSLMGTMITGVVK